MKVIPDGWSAHHAPVSQGAMQCDVALEMPGESTWTPEDGFTPATPVVTWSGRARIQANANAPAQPLTGDQNVTTTTYLIVIPRTAPQPDIEKVRVVVTAVDPNGDFSLVGKRFIIQSVETGTQVWERDLTCQLDETNNEGA
jgi:hypothetical protein